MLDHPVHERDRQRRLADAAHAQHAHHPAALLHDPLLQGGQFRLAPIETRDFQRLLPLHPSNASRLSPLARPGCDAGERWRPLAQQGGEPLFIQQHFLVRRLPQRADLLFLAPGSKGLLLHTERNEAFEVLGLRIAAARLPAEYCSA